jgi:hypothetical protein
MKIFIQQTQQLLLYTITIAFSSCSTNNFSEPQPVAQKNIYSIPKIFRGNWTDKDFARLFVDSSSVSFIDIAEEKITLDSNFILVNKTNISNPAIRYRQINKVSYDTLGLPYDTSIAYIIRHPLIYKITNEDLLETGYKYKQVKDTVIIYRNEKQGIDMGNNAFLRKVTSNMYVFNISNRILIRNNYWWQITLAEKTPNDEINFYVLSDKIKTINPMFYSYTDYYYYDAQWKPADILRLMKEGYFEKTNTFKRIKTVR